MLGVAGLLLGRFRPHLGLAVLVAVIVVTPSLDWQLGMPNSATTFVYMLGLLAGAGWHRATLAAPERRATANGDVARHATVAVQLALLTIAVSSLLAMLRNVPLGELALQLRPALADLAAFNPPGAAGTLQATLVAMMGLVLLALFVGRLDTASKRSMLTTAFTVGIVVAVFSPLFQLLFLNPYVRPDKQIRTGEGLVGFFQDQHSFAAFLVLAIGVSAGLAYGYSKRRQPALATAYAGLSLASTVVLLYTNSRGGLLALAGATLLAVLTWLTLSLRAASTSRQGKRRRLASGVISAIVLATLAGLVVSPSFRGSVQRPLSQLGNPRMWEFLDPETAENPLLARRMLLWSKGAILIAERPIFGTGPKGYSSSGVVVRAELLEAHGEAYGTSESDSARQELEVENAHSYFLQYAAEYGVPALACLLAVLTLVMTTTWHGAMHRPDVLERGLLAGIVFGQVAFVIFSFVSHPLLLAEAQGAFWTLSALAIATVIPRADDQVIEAADASR